MLCRDTRDHLAELFDADYAYDLAVRLTKFRTNDKLGYRPGGSFAEAAAGEMLAGEMRSIGLKNITRDAIATDTWTFTHAELTFHDAAGIEATAVLGGYQTQFETVGPKEFTVLYGGRGTRGDLEKLDVKDKLVLIDINQRDDWWISFPAFEAHLRGAAAVFAAQSGGYAQVNEDALNAQDICGPSDAAAFSISRKDADRLKAALESAPGGEIAVTFDACSRIGRDGTSYNIWGEIPGREPGKLVLMTAHYDAYFDGFQDNATSVALMFSIARALVKTGYRPDKTFIFCAVAAEEWGIADSRYDWSAGAYRQIFTARPEWAGKAVADINLELPGYNMDYKTAQIRANYELRAFIESFAREVIPVEGVFPEGIEVITPTQTWSDDFSFSIAGIPSVVSALREDYAIVRYHTQFDDASTFHAGAFQYHYNIYSALMLAFDRCAAPPLDFSETFRALSQSVDADLLSRCGADAEGLLLAASRAEDAAKRARARINDKEVYGPLLALFRQAQEDLVRLTWDYVATFPHEPVMQNLSMLLPALEALGEGRAAHVLREYLWAVDNNWYAYHWSPETYRQFTDSVTQAPKERLSWGYGRVTGHADLYEIVQKLQAKGETGDCAAEAEALERVIEAQKSLLVRIVREEIGALSGLTRALADLEADSALHDPATA